MTFKKFGENMMRVNEEHNRKWVEMGGNGYFSMAEIMSICHFQFLYPENVLFSHFLPLLPILPQKPPKKHYVLIWVHIRTHIL